MVTFFLPEMVFRKFHENLSPDRMVRNVFTDQQREKGENASSYVRSTFQYLQVMSQVPCLLLLSSFDFSLSNTQFCKLRPMSQIQKPEPRQKKRWWSDKKMWELTSVQEVIPLSPKPWISSFVWNWRLVRIYDWGFMAIAINFRWCSGIWIEVFILNTESSLISKVGL